MVKVVSDTISSISAPRRGGGRILWDFLNSSMENIFLEMHYQPSSLPRFLTPLYFLQSQKEFSVFIQRSVTEIFSQERDLGLRESRHQMACFYHGLRQQFHQVKLSITNISFAKIQNWRSWIPTVTHWSEYNELQLLIPVQGESGKGSDFHLENQSCLWVCVTLTFLASCSLRFAIKSFWKLWKTNNGKQFSS